MLIALALLGSHACAHSTPSGSSPSAIVDDAGATDGARPPAPLADAGGSDAALEASDENAPGAPPLPAFVDAVSAAFCARLGECCFAAEYGGWKQARCVSSVDGSGGLKLLGVHRAATQGAAPRVAYDADRAADCLNRVRYMSCTIARAEYETVRDTCFAALQGTVPLGGSGCTDAIECAAGRCDTKTDGGKCVPLLAVGQPCTSSDDCSYRGMYAPPMFCDDDTTRSPTPSCAPQLAVGGRCAGDTDFEGACASGICPSEGKCDEKLLQADPATCATYRVADGGGI